MSQFLGETQFEHGKTARTGILICNLGTPDAPNSKAVRRYLRQFLSDPRVIEVPKWIWWWVLNFIILVIRPKRSAHAYKKIWTNSGSPLLTISQNITEGIQKELDQRLRNQVVCELGMRYGQPSISDALRKLKTAGARRILILPLYPQYSATTTGSSIDAVCQELMTWRWVPEIRTINQYYDEPGYINSLCNSIRDHWKAFGQGEKLLFSFHSIPKSYFNAGDPYSCFCEKTARLVAQRLELNDDQWSLSFQSRMGAQEWLKPYTDLRLKELANAGVKSIDVICPGFAADCLETLEEIAITDRDIFLQAGGERFHYISALNDRPDHTQAIADIIIKSMQGWPETDPNWHASQDEIERKQSQELASKRGATR